MSRISVLDHTVRMNNIQLQSSNHVPSQGTVSSLNGRLVVNAGNRCLDGCLDCVTSIPKMIGRFLRHRYADFRMFFRSSISMVGGTTREDIHRRIGEIQEFIAVIETSRDRNVVREGFRRLSPGVRDLFFYVDQNYVDEFVHNLSQAPEIAIEMIRECEQVISFQRQLTAVNAFYRMFFGGTNGRATRVQHPDMTTHPRPFTLVTEDLFSTVFPPGLVRVGGSITSDGQGSVTVHGFNLEVPGTVPYVQNAIPADIQQKAIEINRLKTQFAALTNPPAVPGIFNDIIMADDFMEIPVFDASHPGVQSALLPGATTTAINNRDVRHLFDKDALENHFQAHGSSWAPAKCPTCRHPEHGGIRREYLRVDIDLQNQILQFLRNATGSSLTR